MEARTDFQGFGSVISSGISGDEEREGELFKTPGEFSLLSQISASSTFLEHRRQKASQGIVFSLWPSPAGIIQPSYLNRHRTAGYRCGESLNPSSTLCRDRRRIIKPILNHFESSVEESYFYKCFSYKR